MNFIYKVKHKKTDLYLSEDSLLDATGKVFIENPQRLNLNLLVFEPKLHMPAKFETTSADWVIEEYLIVSNNYYQPKEKKRDFSLDAAAIQALYNVGYLSDSQRLSTENMLGQPIRDKTL